MISFLHFLLQVLVYIGIAIACIIAFIIVMTIGYAIQERVRRALAPRCPACDEEKLDEYWSTDSITPEEDHGPPDTHYYNCPSCHALYHRTSHGPLKRDQPLLHDAEELRRRYAREACKMLLSDEDPPRTDPFASWFGKILVSLPGEEWPTNDRGPLVPLLQINCAELPYRPPSLQKVAMLLWFMQNPRDLSYKDDPVLLRAYDRLEDLVPIPDPPPVPEWLKPHPIRWELTQDYPAFDSIPPRLARELLGSGQAAIFDQHTGSKVGGWPSPVQSSDEFGLAEEQDELTIQLCEEKRANWSWGDTGVWYAFATGEKDWEVAMQCS